MNRIINSVADNDLYNFHMGDFFYHNYRGAPVKYTYKNRDLSIDLRPVVTDLREQLEMMADLVLTDNEAEHMLANSKCSEEYLEYLTKTKVFNPRDYQINYSNGLQIGYGGEVQDKMYCEVSLMSVVSELHFRHLYADRYDEVLASGEKWLQEQVAWLNEHAHPKLSILEMGGRRRFSYDHHKKALKSFWEGTKVFKGTSNVHLGMELGIPYFGTMAHQLPMFMQTVYPVAISQQKALEEWNRHFKGSLDTALTDTLGNAKWDRDFTKEYADMFRGERHDSGDPYEWADQRIEAAIDRDDDLSTRRLMFSDSLTFEKANELTAAYCDAVGEVGSGIGTFVSNSMGVEGHKPIPQVSKMTWANGLPTCKLSADLGKSQGEDLNHTEYTKHVAAVY